eukprot:9274488-Pyramimonas_sp.AAC.1
MGRAVGSLGVPRSPHGPVATRLWDPRSSDRRHDVGCGLLSSALRGARGARRAAILSKWHVR